MRGLLFVALIVAFVIPCYAGMVVDVDKLTLWIQANQREEGTVIVPPVVPPTPPPVTPPVGEWGSKTNPFKVNVPYSKVINGFTAERKGVSFSVGKVYLEVDPLALKPDAASFQMTVKGMNCPTLRIYRAYCDKTTSACSDDVRIGIGGVSDTMRSNPTRPFSNTKVLYYLENYGASWIIEAWVQVQ